MKCQKETNVKGKDTSMPSFHVALSSVVYLQQWQELKLGLGEKINSRNNRTMNNNLLLELETRT